MEIITPIVQVRLRVTEVTGHGRTVGTTGSQVSSEVCLTPEPKCFYCKREPAPKQLVWVRVGAVRTGDLGADRTQDNVPNQEEAQHFSSWGTAGHSSAADPCA